MSGYFTRALCFTALAVGLPILMAQEPAPKAASEPRPPWQRLLQGEEAKRAARLEQRMFQSDGQEAITAAKELLKLRETAQGADHWQTAEVRQRLAMLRYLAEQPEDLRREYLKISDLIQRVDAQQQKGRLTDASQAMREIVQIHVKVFGEYHLETAKWYDILASEFLSDLQEAEEYHRKALKIFRSVLGDGHPDTARCYGYLARNAAAQGMYAEAEVHLRKALDIRRKSLGEEDIVTIASYNNLGEHLIRQGKCREAEFILREALTLTRDLFGDSHPSTAAACNNLASASAEQGRLAQAEDLFGRALEIKENVKDPNPTGLIIGHLNMATILERQGKLTSAQKHNREALVVLRNLPGEAPPQLATKCLEGVGSVLTMQKKYAEAEEPIRDALAIYRQKMGEDHPETSRCAADLALCLDAQGKYAEAEKECRKALTVLTNRLGEGHPVTAGCYMTLAAIRDDRGDSKGAEAYVTRAANSNAQRRREAVSRLGLDRASWDRSNSVLRFLAVLLARNGKPDLAWQRLEQDLGASTWEEMSARRRGSPEDWAELNKLQASLEQLDQLLERAPSRPAPTGADEQRRTDLLRRRREIEGKLAACYGRLDKSQGFTDGLSYSRERVQDSLANNVAFVAWVDHGRVAGNRQEHWVVVLRSRGLPVWVALPGTGAGGAWTEEDVNLSDTFLRALTDRDGLRRPGWEELARRLVAQRIEPIRKYLVAADELPPVGHLVVLPSSLMDGIPIELLVENTTVSYAPSATVFAALRNQRRPGGAGLFALGDPVFERPAFDMKPPPLPDKGVLVTMVLPNSNAAQSDLRPNDVLLKYNGTPLRRVDDLKAAMQQPEPPRLVRVEVWGKRNGKVQTFEKELRSGPLGVLLAPEPAQDALARQRKFDEKLDAGSRGKDLTDLPGTRVEVEGLRRLFEARKESARVLTDSEASEQRLFELARDGELARARYLHIATHGDINAGRPLQSALIMSQDALPDPLKQLLAGKPAFDGRVTAQEVLQFWKLDAELVTLSACQSGLGKHEVGEGFVGFAQSFLLAGSRSVCLSLWNADDIATVLLMTRFYQNLLGERQGLKAPMAKAAALAEAKEWLRTLPRSQVLPSVAQLTKGVVRAKGRPLNPQLPEVPQTLPGEKDPSPYAHPYYWAAFVLVGSPD